MASKKRNTRLTDVDKETENVDTSDKGEISQSRYIMQGIASIQKTLANFLLRSDGQGKHLDDLTQEIRARDGINERLKKVQDQTVETENLISELREKKRKMERERRPLTRLFNTLRVLCKCSKKSNNRSEDKVYGKQCNCL